MVADLAMLPETLMRCFRPTFRPVPEARSSGCRWRWNYRDVVLALIALFFLQGLARGAEDPPPRALLTLGETPAAYLRTDVHLAVTGVVAEVEVRQRFRNDTTRWLEGDYTFPLPVDAALAGMTLEIGERRIEGEIREREAAREAYEAARAEGRRTSLVGQEAGNLFRTRVANVGPGEEVGVTLRYTELLGYRDEHFSLRFPTTLTPRYGEGGAGPADQSVGPLTLTVDLRPGVPTAYVEAPHHDVRVERRGEAFRITLAEGATAPDRDFELVWAPLLGQAPRAALMTQEHEGDRYGLLLFVPPQPEFRTPRARELILVIDRSGSMGGEPIRQARESLRLAVGSLDERDRFNVIAFASDVDRLFPAPVPAIPANIGRAIAWLDRLSADGGTDMAPALAAATAGRPPEGTVRQIVFVTDGAVGGERQLFAQIARDLGDARLFTVGIGAAPNAYFMRKAAEFGRGSYSYVGSEAQVAERMDALLSRLEHPLLTDLCADWPGAAEAYPPQLPDLYRGEPLVVAVRLGAATKGPIRLCGRLEDGWWEETLEPGDAHPGFAVATLWARRKVEGLMDDLVLGADPEAVRAEVVRLALAHRLVTRFTSLVAVDRTPARSAAAAQARIRFGHAAPSGATAFVGSGPQLALPQTDAGTVMRSTLGVLLLVLGFALARRLEDPT